MNNETPIIQNWCIVGMPPNGMDPAYCPPELLEPRFVGFVHGHPTRSPEKCTAVSSYTGWDEDKQEVICSSRNYRLGEVDPNYEEKHPNARERFIEQLKTLNK